MKKILLVIMLLNSTTLVAANWKFLGTPKYNNVGYIDTESIERSGHIVKFWQKFDIENTTNEFSNDKTELIMYSVISCKDREYYSKFKNEVSGHPIVPGSTMEYFYKYLCKRH